MSDPSAGDIALYECASCERRWQSRYAGCPYCGSSTLAEIMVNGSGRVYSWVTVHRVMADGSPPVPYSVLTVALDAGARVFARFEHDSDPAADLPVECYVDWAEPGLRARLTTTE